jgi:hypothetical protein
MPLAFRGSRSPRKKFKPVIPNVGVTSPFGTGQGDAPLAASRPCALVSSHIGWRGEDSRYRTVP